MKILEYLKISKQNFIMWIFAFLFTVISFVLSFFTLSNVETLGGISSELTGVNIIFGNEFDAFILVGWICILLTMVSMIVSLFYKKIGVLQGFLLVVAVLIFGFLPQIINSPLPNDPEITKYVAAEHSAILIIMIVTLSLSFIFNLSLNLDSIKFTTREICELAMLVALAVVLNFFPKIPLQWAGSINFQIVPLVIIALRFSPFKTFLSCGMIFGLITCFTDGYGLFAFPLEYLVAFGSVAIISPFRKYILKDRTDNKKGYILPILLLVLLIGIQTTIRFLCASIDSYIFYYAYLDISASGNAITAALVYNAPYTYLTGVATIGVIVALYYPLVLINKRFKN